MHIALLSETGLLSQSFCQQRSQTVGGTHGVSQGFILTKMPTLSTFLCLYLLLPFIPLYAQLKIKVYCAAVCKRWGNNIFIPTRTITCEGYSLGFLSWPLWCFLAWDQKEHVEPAHAANTRVPHTHILAGFSCSCMNYATLQWLQSASSRSSARVFVFVCACARVRIACAVFQLVAGLVWVTF